MQHVGFGRQRGCHDRQQWQIEVGGAQLIPPGSLAVHHGVDHHAELAQLALVALEHAQQAVALHRLVGIARDVTPQLGQRHGEAAREQRREQIEPTMQFV
ncbi:MAG: hypothetical protein EBV77_03635 [Gemmatimonadaceae bacterium]|nr:hypothetical protein [Gemmatimonadaceae bacterium]